MVNATASTGKFNVSVEKIHVPTNVRPLDEQHVDALAGSIALQGLLVPVIVTPATGEPADQGYQYELVGGFHRYAAVTRLGYAVIEAVLHPPDGAEHGSAVASARATENIVRKQLNAYEEAVAVRAMLDRGLSEDGAGQALGWPKARVTARVKLLELPEIAQQMIGDGLIPLAAVDQLRQIGKVSPALLDTVISFIADGNEWVAERLAREPGWVIDSVLRRGDSKVFAAHMTQVDSHQLPHLKLGKKTDALVQEAIEIHRNLDRYAYGSPAFPFAEEDVDQARAGGVLIEFAGSRPIIADRSLYRELCKQAIKRTVEQLRARQLQVAQERKAAKASGQTQPADPAGEAKRQHGRQMRQLAEQAHGVNIELGWALRNELAVVDPSDPTVAKFYVYALLGSDYDGSSPYTQSSELVAELAVRGIRLVIDEFRIDVTKTRKDGSKGALRIAYTDPKKPEDPVAWMWKFIDGAKTAGELYGRALVVIAAERYALRLVVPSSQQHPAKRWPSHKDHAAKALAKLVDSHLPGSLKQLEKAVAKAKADYDKQLAELNSKRGKAPAATTAAAGEVEDDADLDGDQDSYELLDDDLEDEYREYAGAVGPDGAVYSDADPGL
jgi:ParB/RepB/Spo0J family partition protein